MTRWIYIIAFALVTAGCGGHPETTAPEDTASVEESAEGRVVVARVNGEPVFADCVEARAPRFELSPRDALSECIDFELLAQEAESRGHADHPAVQRERRREAARALIERDFEQRYDSPEAIPREVLEKLWARPPIHSRYNRPEYRFMYFARAQLDEKTATDEDDARARKAMNELYRRLRGKTLDTRFDFFDAAEKLARDFPEVPVLIERRSYNTPLAGRADPAFAKAAFEIPAPRMVSPPTRTPWGWDVIFLSGIAKARRATLDEVEDQIRKIAFPSWQRQQFLLWSNGLLAKHDIAVDLELLEEVAAAGELAAGAPVELDTLMSSPFADIMRRAVEATPGAVGGAFAAGDGETVDAFAANDPEEWAILTAHFGILFAWVQSALNTFHHGEAEFMMISHTRLDVIVHAVAEGYFALMAVHPPAPLGVALTALERAALELREEMA